MTPAEQGKFPRENKTLKTRQYNEKLESLF